MAVKIRPEDWLSRYVPAVPMARVALRAVGLTPAVFAHPWIGLLGTSMGHLKPRSVRRPMYCRLFAHFIKYHHRYGLRWVQYYPSIHPSLGRGRLGAHQQLRFDMAACLSRVSSLELSRRMK
jgi:hypothetical protein